MFPIQIKYFDVNNVYAGGEDFWIMWKELDDTDGKDGNEEDLWSKQVEAMTVCCPANEQHPARPATRSNIPHCSNVSKFKTKKQ